MVSSKIRGPLVIFSLVIRTLLFIGFSFLFVSYFSFIGVQNPWDEAIKWWVYQALFAGIVTFPILFWLLRREKINYFKFIGVDKKRLPKDIGLGFLYGVLGAVVGGIGIYGTAYFIYGGLPPETLFQPLPLWAVFIALVLVPISIAAVEAPIYIGYALPRLQILLKRKWSAILVASFALAFQHIALPLVFDWQFMLWRVLAFLPVAIVLAVIFLKTKRLFPLMIAHFLMDLQVMVTILAYSL